MAARVTLGDPLQFVRGVGPVRAREFASIGLETVGHLLEYLPFRYDLRPKSQAIGTLQLDQTATIVGELHSVSARSSYGRRPIKAKVVDGTGWCDVRWFNTPHLADNLRPGVVLRLTGKVDQHRDTAQMTNPQTSIFEKPEDAFVDDQDRFDPVYSATANLPSKLISRVVGSVLDEAVEQVVDPLPDELRDRRNLPPLRASLTTCHRPVKLDDVPIARRRLAYDELLVCQLAMQLSRGHRRSMRRALPMALTDEIDRRIRRRFPFTLTSGQDKVISEIAGDLGRAQPMNRLLQADVGAGKTAIAVYAALTAIASKRQVALIAPTEVLASQHRAKVQAYLEGSRVKTAFLTGSTSAQQRRTILRGLQAGSIDFLIGTHAMLEPDVKFASLGLVIIDEQHKFGVEQRAALREKGGDPHTLVLTATPIPRTLAMTVFGDLDVSTIREVLPGRQPIDTRLIRPDSADECWSFVRSCLAAGDQAFVVYPLVEESESWPLKAASVEVERLSVGELAGYKLALLHGRMKPKDKQDVMDAFRRSEVDVLVSTTVIEVGVDVPNASVMVIQHAERYGLSQLHQLRGRIGRGKKKSYCMLMSDSVHGPAAERLEVLCRTNDGFVVADEDLRIRGPGEFMGTRQHGMPAFRVADLTEDVELLEQARDDAADLLRGDPRLQSSEHRLLRGEVIRRYRDALRLVHAG